MSIFPKDSNIEIKVINDTDEVFKEYAIDLNTGKMIYKDGKNLIVTKDEALRVWIWKVLKTAKATYQAYDLDYGNELEKIIGNGYSKALAESELRRITKEAISYNKYIKDMQNFSVVLEGSKAIITFTAITKYGEVNIIV